MVLLFLSQGTPLLLAGDEFGNSKGGNNNTYCQDNEISWLDWGLLEENRALFQFFQYMIRFRKEHRVLRTSLSNGACGFPDVSFHGVEPLHDCFADHERYVGVLFAGWDRQTGPEVVYVASNAYWEEVEVTLPELPISMCWNVVVDTWEEYQKPYALYSDKITLGPRSLMVVLGE